MIAKTICGGREFVALLLTAALGSPAAAMPSEFLISQTRDGRNVAIWRGSRPPTAQELRAVLSPVRTPSAGAGDRLAAPAPAVDAIVLDSLGDMRFDFARADLTAEARAQLESVCAAFSVDPELRRVKLHLIGHTCSIGTPQANVALSRQRAATAASFLAQCLRGPGRIAGTEARGENDPLVGVPHDSPMQRRVEIALIRPLD